MSLLTRIGWVLLGIALSIRAVAQTPAPKSIAPTPAQPGQEVIEDPLGRTTPHGTVLNFIRAVEQGDLDRSAEYLNSSAKPQKKQELAQTLKQVMDRGLKINLATLSKDPGGNPGDSLSLTRESVGVAKIGEEEESIEILLDRVEKSGQQSIWLFASETLSKVTGFAIRAEDSWFIQYVPGPLRAEEFLGIALYRWIVVPVLLLLLLGAAWFGAWVLTSLFGRIFRSHIQAIADIKKIRFAAPVRLLLFAALMSFGAQYVSTLLARQFWLRVAIVLIVLGGTWLFLRAIDFIAWLYIARMQQNRAQHRIAAVQLIRGSAKAVVVILALLIALNTQGVNLGTAIAGLGIGGLAIAFAAQKTLENLFGTVMLVADSPVRMGDFCRVGDKLGTIENIGLRSTRIRTLDQTVVTVPNGQVAAMVLENFAPRQKVWFFQTVSLRYGTTADQLRYVLSNTHAMLCQHPSVESGSARIRFVRFGASSLDLEVFAYVLTHEYPVFLKIQEELLLHIMDIVKASGTEIAIPSRTMYVKNSIRLEAEENKAVGALAEQ
jgi:MscS family membrane protein